MPTPPRLTTNDLRVGASYLHANGLFIRHIDAIEGNTVIYHEQDGPPHQCSKAAFLKACRSVTSPAPPSPTDNQPSTPPFTLRDEANALTAYAFRNGFLEDLHAGKSSPLLDQPGYSRISDDEMKRLMIEASEKLARMLALKRENPTEYDQFIRNYQRTYCRAWKRD